ncbi:MULTISPECIES: winged helix-turn-helix domain-containing protein [Amycolatopsis]|uniref:GntR family transcriptional regulator n=1 Tax=Amycolatopsis TaxID=1813 RepID=UPI0018E922EA|nr:MULTISPECIES: winged helix-turn-helix domain-containing protein [Amycolatopsis]
MNVNADVFVRTDPRVFAYQAYASYLRRQILACIWPYNAVLPNERAMALQSGLSVGTVRRALGVLREEGLVVTITGKGTFVNHRRRAEEAP